MTQLDKQSGLYWLLTVLAGALPALILVLPWYPEGETTLIWFLRSGGLMTIFALLGCLFYKSGQRFLLRAIEVPPINMCLSVVGILMLVMRDIIQ